MSELALRASSKKSRMASLMARFQRLGGNHGRDGLLAMSTSSFGEAAGLVAATANLLYSASPVRHAYKQESGTFGDKRAVPILLCGNSLVGLLGRPNGSHLGRPLQVTAPAVGGHCALSFGQQLLDISPH